MKPPLTAPDNTTPAQADVDALRDLLDLMENFSSNDQRARYLLSCNWMRDREAAAIEARRRLSETEARKAHPSSVDDTWASWVCDEYLHVAVGEDRMLAECEAKRRIAKVLIERHRREGMLETSEESILHALAAVYADHPDYRDEWRP